VDAHCAPTPTPAPTDSHDASRRYLEVAFAAFLPFFLRILQSAGMDKCMAPAWKKLGGEQPPEIEAHSGNPLKEAFLAPSDTRAAALRGKVGWFDLADTYAGWDGWTKARKELGYSACMALLVGASRLFFWHLMQPAVYAWVLYSYSEQIDALQLKLGCAVLARETIYVLLMLLALRACPAVLLVNLEADEDAKGRLRDKLLYVLAPEKFVAFPVLKAAVGKGAAGLFMFLVTGLVLPALDVCGVYALVVGAKAGLLPAALAVGYGATAASLLALLGIPSKSTIKMLLITHIYTQAIQEPAYAKNTPRLGVKTPQLIFLVASFEHVGDGQSWPTDSVLR
jgi:hypothetical protein